ncbi:maleylpyruvate isomerase family mycothiol-dependent enzyme [Aquipuribacter hungaricus]|uniref:Maleylpyruvate isomerase family mycothiol-dependent enzyme n=1 Tax=Aquipuribacter hungaricus TaxID=545624 RepID=A0ABV7WE51_9MICO
MRAAPDDLGHRTAANRRAVADLVATLDEDQLRGPSLCAGWTCRDVVGHLLVCIEMSVPRFLLEVARDRGRADAASDRLARARAARPVGELVEVLRRRSGDAVSQPGVGPHGPFADSCIHLRDIAVPLGLAATPPVADWTVVLAFLVTPRARAAGFLPRGRLDGLRLEADDTGWSAGDGALVSGSSEALALVVSGRPAGLDGVTGPGAALLRDRVTPGNG